MAKSPVSRVRSAIAGLIRGMLHDGVEPRTGIELGDVDPTGERGYVDTISHKTRAVGGGVLEAILPSYRSQKFHLTGPATINCKG